MEELVGRALGPRGQYRLIELLGRGGMGAVYRAEQVALKRQVAVKVVDPTLTRQEGFIERFEQEARIIARLEHAHILPVYDFGEEEGLFYLVMRLVSGGALKDRMPDGDNGRWTPAQALALARQMLPALDYAHREGVVHRDLKPGNILMQGDWAFLADFGVAKLVQGEQGLTGYGVVVGTPEYMAPEQVLGLPLDGRADLYAFAMVLYEALTGTLPYRADSPMAVALHQVQTPLPPPRQYAPALPEAVAAVLVRALAKNRDERYPNGEELVAALEEAIGDTAPPRSTRPLTLSGEPAPGPATSPATGSSTPATVLGAGARQAPHGPAGRATDEQAARAEAEQAERVRAEAAAAEQQAQEQAERDARATEQQAREWAERDARAAERQAQEQAERAAAGRAERERAERDADERAAQEREPAAARSEQERLERAAPEPVPSDASAVLAGVGIEAGAVAPARPRPTGGGVKPLWLAAGVVALLVIGGAAVAGSGVLSPAAPTAAPTTAPAVTRAAAPAAPTTAGAPIVAPTGVATAAGVAPATAALATAAPPVAPASMATPRAGDALVALPDGGILAIGGVNGKDVLASAERYDPVANAWSPAGTMTAGRSGHTATLLRDGRVLVAGGQASDTVILNSVELYDPRTNSWSRAADLATPRSGHTATLLPDGKVLVVGGSGAFGMVGTAELYDPAANAWSTAGSLADDRKDHAAALLPDGGVLVVGGAGTNAAQTAERWDPASHAWQSAGSLATGRTGHTATPLRDGRVLLAGGATGTDGSPQASVEIYDPGANTWAAGPAMGTARAGHIAALLPDGTVLVAGGLDAQRRVLGSAERFDPAANRWTAAGDLATPRREFAAVLVPGGRILVAGGAAQAAADSPGLASAEVYDPATNAWAAGG